MKKVAIIPVLLGSTRVPDKNLLLVDGYPMVFYVARSCKESGVFDEIYINSEHTIFEDCAEMLGTKFYPRRPDRGGSACTMGNKSRRCKGDRCQTHDHFLFDFMDSISSDYLALVHTTSPLLKPTTIQSFMSTLEESRFDSLFSVEERRTETVWGSEPLNFSFSEKIPTQTLPPVRMITWALSAWKTESFVQSYLRDDPKENGPSFCGKVGFCPINRIEALDADTWEDLHLIEAALEYQRQGLQPGEHRLRKDTIGIEHDLRSLIARDGVVRFQTQGSNQQLSNLEEIKRQMGDAPWIYLLVNTSDDQIGLICQEPGEGARKHYHVTHDEWWVVLEGEFQWCLEDDTVITGKEADVVFLPKGRIHSIVCTSDKPGIRLACGAQNMEHIYVS